VTDINKLLELGNIAFRYGEFPRLCGILSKYIKTTDDLLMIGCGNSNLSADLYDVGFHNLVNIDISATVIVQMVQKNLKSRPAMQFLHMDMLQVICLVFPIYYYLFTYFLLT